MAETRPLISEDMLHQIEDAARAQHREPAEVLEEAWKRYTEEQSWVKLVTEGRESAARLGIQESDVDRLIGEYRQREARALISATLDTSVYIRAFNFGGPAAALLGHARAGDLRIDISDAILDETTGVLREKFQRDPYTTNDVRQKLEKLCNRVTPTQTLDIVKEDPDDNRILECAAAAKSDYLVTEDKDLLRVGQYEGTKIVTIGDFMKLALTPAKGI